MRREKKGREAEFPRWHEAGEIGKNNATLLDILQSKKQKEAEAKRKKSWNRDLRVREAGSLNPLSPTPLSSVNTVEKKNGLE